MNMKKLRHRVQVNVSDGSPEKQKVVSNTHLRLPRRLLKLIFGEVDDVMVITTGRSVDSIEIREAGGCDD